MINLKEYNNLTTKYLQFTYNLSIILINFDNNLTKFYYWTIVTQLSINIKQNDVIHWFLLSHREYFKIISQNILSNKD